MCGRYVIAGVHELSERFQLRTIPLDLFPTWNAAPTQRLPVVVEDDDGERALRLMQWGLQPRWSRPGSRPIAPINARAETLADKPMFRGLLRRSRCIVPVNGFYEWRQSGGRKQPYYIAPDDGGIWGLAGLYDQIEHVEEPDGEPLWSYTIVTTAANPLLTPLHERMPAILRPDDEDDWLSRDIDDPRQLEMLLRPAPDAEIALRPVGSAVNSARNNGPKLIAADEGGRG
ncbi:MAG TPA: SOS response-associated peptidase [Thermomicrobiales bacterium]|nr:SOS response-associated peptidase [Thermomicrobiales bacterium]